ncbi:MAG: hypothetical protein J6S43_05835 [Lentisphaeria bacterium]|jgi:hypothetical protein|nr:hypothetical protein [Lentisphaeria bacterium]
MKINKVLLSILAVSAFSCTYAEERVLNMDFSEAPEKIEEVRTKAGGKKKNETVDFYIAIPPTEGKDFTFQCLLKPTGMRSYSGFSVGIGARNMTSRQFTAQVRMGDGNRTAFSFLNKGKAIAKPVGRFKVEPLTITMQYSAASGTMDFSAVGKAGNVISKAEKIPVRYNDFSVNSILISVIDKPGAGEAYLFYNAKAQQLEGKSFFNNSFFSTFVVDDVKITYAE